MKVIRQFTGEATRTVSVPDGTGGAENITETFTTYNDIAVEDDENGNPSIAFSDGKEAYATIIADAIRTLVGELQLDTARGIDYERTVWMNNLRIPEWERQVKKRVMEYPFVEEIISFISNHHDHVFSYEIKVLTSGGETVTVNG